MLSGFINYGMNWKWTLWWCAIWNAIAFVYCFFLMEETNYDRKHDSPPPQAMPTPTEAPVVSQDVTNEKSTPSTTPEDREAGQIIWPRKSYLDKLGIKDKKRPNRMINIMIAPFKGFTYPAVVYAGYVFTSSRKKPQFKNTMLTLLPTLASCMEATLSSGRDFRTLPSVPSILHSTASVQLP